MKLDVSEQIVIVPDERKGLQLTPASWTFRTSGTVLASNCEALANRSALAGAAEAQSVGRRGIVKSATELLSLIAELGVAFAGFLAVFLIFARRDGRFSPADSVRVRAIIAASFTSIFMALLPLCVFRSIVNTDFAST